MTDLINLNEKASTLIKSAQFERGVINEFRQQGKCETRLQVHKRRYEKIMNEFKRVINEIQKLTYEKYI
jgi:hypothetical protein